MWVEFELKTALARSQYTQILNCISMFLQAWNFRGSLVTPRLKIWGSLTNLEGQNFLISIFDFMNVLLLLMDIGTSGYEK